MPATDRFDDGEDETPSLEGGDGLLTHREIASRLGIGRARVFFHEQEALAKIRQALSSSGISSFADFDVTPLRVSVKSDQAAQPQQPRFSSQHGWLKVSRIISINDGCTEAHEVAESFRLLKLRQDKLLRPPVHLSSAWGTATPYRIEAAAADSDGLFLRCWPIGSAPRTVEAISRYRSTAIVESIFDKDHDGDFDVPLLICVIVSAGAAKGSQG